MAAISGPEVVSSGVKGNFLGALGDTLLSGIRGAIDVEVAKRSFVSPDRSDIAEAAKTAAPAPAAKSADYYLKTYGLGALGLAVVAGVVIYIARG